MIQSCIIIATQRRFFHYLAQEQLENFVRESGDGGRHACATVWSITVEIAGSSFGMSWLYPSTGRSWTSGHVLRNAKTELMRERKTQEGGPEGRRREAAIPISDPREPTITEKEVHELTQPQPWCEQCVRGRGTENPHKRVTFERAESTLHSTSASSRLLEPSPV